MALSRYAKLRQKRNPFQMQDHNANNTVSDEISRACRIRPVVMWTTVKDHVPDEVLPGSQYHN